MTVENNPPAGSGTGAGSTNTENMVPQSRLNEMAAEKNKYKDELEALRKAQADKETEEAAKKGEFQKLAETAQKRVGELEPQLKSLTTERDMLKAVVDSQLKAEIDALPDELKAIIPDDASYDVKAALLAKAKPLVDKLVGKTESNPGSAPKPKPTDKQRTPTSEALAKAKEELLKSGRYSI